VEPGFKVHGQRVVGDSDKIVVNLKNTARKFGKKPVNV
jgi:hypothetical protein